MDIHDRALLFLTPTFFVIHIYSAAPMYPDVTFWDWFLWGLFGSNFWAIQYIATFWSWSITGGLAAWRLAKHGAKDRYALAVLFATAWYLSIQVHWIVKEASKHAGYIEWWWSLFEAFVAVLLLLALCRRN